jgi:hypothetical protein
MQILAATSSDGVDWTCAAADVLGSDDWIIGIVGGLIMLLGGAFGIEL